MMQSPTDVLATLDAASDAYVFPMLDNGYVYLAATRLSLFRSSSDWAIVVEVFGFSPRAGVPDLAVSTFGSTLRATKPGAHHDARYLYPLVDGPWRDEEFVAQAATFELSIRGQRLSLPPRSEYERVGIALSDLERAHVSELSRYLAAVARDRALATANEQRVSVLPDVERMLVLDEWHHPDLANDEWPNDVESFQQLAEVLSTGDVSRYRPTASPNTHWKNWPDGGTL